MSTESASLRVLIALLLVSLCASATWATWRATDRRADGAALQKYSAQQTPTQSAVPASTEKSQEPPNTPRTEQYTLSQDRYEKAVAYSRAEYILWFLSFAVNIAALILFLRFGISVRLRDL